jgi:hypothetical protein
MSSERTDLTQRHCLCHPGWRWSLWLVVPRRRRSRGRVGGVQLERLQPVRNERARTYELDGMRSVPQSGRTDWTTQREGELRL